MPKIHLIISADPIHNGVDATALCGETIKNASAIPLTEMERPESTLLFCKNCFGRNYFYALTTGQEAKDLEISA